MSANVYISRHPLVLDLLSLLRDEATAAPEFRRVMHEISQLLFFEATQDLVVAPRLVRTPLGDCYGQRLTESLGLAPILRAGLGMAHAIHELVPHAPVWHLGLYRDHNTLMPVTYYNKLPPQPALDLCFVLDPMLATGGSAVAAIDILKQRGVHRLKFIGLIAAPEGIEALHRRHPDVPIHLAACDSRLDERKYIVPGLGDAGDRQFAT